MRNIMKISSVAALAFALLTVPDVRAEEHHTHEKVALADVPQAAKAALTKEAKGQELKDVRKETRNGQTYYEADITENGKRVELNTSADGKNVQRENEEGDEDDES